MQKLTNYRKDQALQSNKLIEQARDLDSATDSTRTNSPSTTEKEVEADPTRISQKAPAHRLSEQYTRNIVALGRSQQFFRRHQDNPSKRVVKSPESGLTHNHEPELPSQSIGIRNPTPALSPTENSPSLEEEPMHLTQPKAYEEAITTNEEFIAGLDDAPANETSPSPEAGTPPESTLAIPPELLDIIEHLIESPKEGDDQFVPSPVSEEPPPPEPAQSDVTNVNFVYKKEHSPFYKLAKGAIIESGEGKPVVDKGRTRTHIVIPDDLKESE